MSKLRPGSECSLSLFKCDVIHEWESYLQEYDRVIRHISSNSSDKKSTSITLAELDSFMWGSYIEGVDGQDPKHITLEDLSKVMKWKLSRGKFRPLQKLVDSNNSQEVIRISTIAFQYLSDSKWEQAFNSITALKGIGVATASAIFAPFRPDLIPFMADEVIDSTYTTGKRDYTMKVYKHVRDSCILKAKELGRGWDAEMVGKALWVRAMVAKHNTSFKMIVVEATTTSAATTNNNNNNVDNNDDDNERAEGSNRNVMMSSHMDTNMKEATTATTTSSSSGNDDSIHASTYEAVSRSSSSNSSSATTTIGGDVFPITITQQNNSIEGSSVKRRKRGT